MVFNTLISKKKIILFFMLIGNFTFSQTYIQDSVTDAVINKEIIKEYKKTARKQKTKIKNETEIKVFKIFWMHYKNDSSENKKYVLTEELLRNNLVLLGIGKEIKKIGYLNCSGFIYEKDSVLMRFNELAYLTKPQEKYYYLLNIIQTYNILYAFRINNIYNNAIYLVDNKGKIYVFYTEKNKNNKTIYIIKDLKEYKPICCLDLLDKY